MLNYESTEEIVKAFYSGELEKTHPMLNDAIEEIISDVELEHSIELRKIEDKLYDC